QAAWPWSTLPGGGSCPDRSRFVDSPGGRRPRTQTDLSFVRQSFPYHTPSATHRGRAVKCLKVGRMGNATGVEITGPIGARFTEILTEEALSFLADLHRRFDGRR